MSTITQTIATNNKNVTTTDLLKSVILKNTNMTDALGGAEKVSALNFKELGESFAAGSFKLADFMTLTAQFAYTVMESPSFARIYGSLFRTDNRYGSMVRDIYVDLPEVQDYSSDGTKLLEATQQMYQEVILTSEERKMFETSVSQQQALDAFQSEGAMTSFLDSIVSKLVDARNHYEYQRVNLAIQKSITSKEAKEVVVPENSDVNQKMLGLIQQIKEYSYSLPFINRHNGMKVKQTVPKERQVLLTTTHFKSVFETYTMSGAFNKEALGLPEQSIQAVDSLGVDSNGNQIQAILVDRNKFLLSIITESVDTFPNPRSLVTSYFMHYWARFNMSPFADMITFAFGTPVENEQTLAFSNLTQAIGKGDKKTVELFKENIDDVSKYITDNNIKIGVYNGSLATATSSVYTTADKTVDGAYISATLNADTGTVDISSQPNAADGSVQTIALIKQTQENGTTVNEVVSSQVVQIVA